MTPENIMLSKRSQLQFSLYICPIIWKDVCTPMFVAALFTVAKTWKQPKCSLTDEQIKKMWCTHTHTHTHTGILLSHKKEWNNAICSNIDRPRDYHTKWSESEKDKYHMILLICEILKNDLLTKQKQAHIHRKQAYGYHGERWGKG